MPIKSNRNVLMSMSMYVYADIRPCYLCPDFFLECKTDLLPFPDSYVLITPSDAEISQKMLLNLIHVTLNNIILHNNTPNHYNAITWIYILILTLTHQVGPSLHMCNKAIVH